MRRFNIGIIGVTGFTGHELVKILCRHPFIHLVYGTTTSSVGKQIGELYPDLSFVDLVLSEYSVASVISHKLDVVFLAVHHGKAMQYAAELLNAGVRVIDLSADFRFSSHETYEKVYGAHSEKSLCKQAVYGLPERFRAEIRKAKLVANPGCYVTSALLALLPLKEVATDIIIDAKSGVSGAGKKLDEMYLFANLHNNFKAYGIATHRHQPEIEAYLGQPIEFVPHLLPINRGILSTIYFKSKCSLEELREKLVRAYENELFVRVVAKGSVEISMVAGTNHCALSLHAGSRPGTYILVSTLDNLIKGASGQAVQNMNLMLDISETAGLDLAPAYP